MGNITDEMFWLSIVSVTHQAISKIFVEWSKINNQTNILRQALNNPTVPGERYVVLVLLLLGRDNEVTKSVFDLLVDQASVGHSDIDICRLVIKSLPRKWVVDNIESVANKILSGAETEEEYQRFAELYEELDEELLKRLVDQMRCSSDPNLLDIADDFADL